MAHKKRNPAPGSGHGASEDFDDVVLNSDNLKFKRSFPKNQLVLNGHRLNRYVIDARLVLVEARYG